MSFLADAHIVVQALNDYYRESVAQEKPVIQQVPLNQLVKELNLAFWTGQGGLSGEKLKQFVEKYLAATTRIHHPAFMAHQAAVPYYLGALAALIDGFTNNGMSVFEMGPGGASIEFFMINWLLEKVGWKPAPWPMPDKRGEPFGGGVLTHGGSLANLTALLAARSRIAPEVWEQGNSGDLVLLAPAESHYSVARAASILGLGSKAVYALAVDQKGVVIPDRLPVLLKQVQNQGKRVMALVANACSTAVGLYDPLAEIGAFCRENRLWFHVDSAHGAAALLSDRHRHLLRGLDLADSCIWDAHKLMRTPNLCAAVLVKDAETLDRAFQQEASYLFHEKEQLGFDFIHRTVECTKAGLALKFFAVLAGMGEQGLGAYIDRQFQLAQEAYEYIRELPEFECPVSPQSNILCFRIQGSDVLQIAIRDQLMAEGSFHLSTTVFKSKRYLRMVFMSPDTGMEQVKQLIERVRELAEEVKRKNEG